MRPGEVRPIAEVKIRAGGQTLYRISAAQSSPLSFGGSQDWWYEGAALDKATTDPKPDCSAEETLQASTVLLLPEQKQSAFDSLLDKKTNTVNVDADTIYFVRVGDGVADVKEMIDGRILQA